MRWAARRVPYIFGVVLGSWLLGGFCCRGALAQAQILRYQGADGRLYFTNLPPPSGLAPQEAPWRRPAAPLLSPAPVLSLIERLAPQYSVDPRLVQAIITVESNFDPRAVSRAGAQGLMQLMPDTAARYRVTNPFDPHANIEGGMRYLRDLLRMFPHDLRHVLAAYNAGEGTVQQYGGVPPYPETQRYVARVLALYGASVTPSGKIYRYHTTSGSILLTDTPR